MKYSTPFGMVDVPNHSGNIGISCSGGADSAILLYAMVKDGMSPRVFFIEKANSKLEALQRCVDYINARFGSSLSIEIIGRTDSTHNIRPDIIALAAKVDFLYTGVTQNPPVQINGLPPNRPSPNQPPSKFIMPFVSIDKRASIYLYNLFGVNDLLDLTYTCTENPITPCNQCFACSERNWAIANQ
jgi:7-cyano-7-deazaguanine synthase in queuosine biosynthesis